MSSIRQQAQRKIKSAITSMDNAGRQLFCVAETYRANHPEISKNIDLAMSLLAQTMELSEHIKKSF